MKHVGIMSMQRIANYGSFLQAYALKNLIEDIGCQVEFVDYRIEPPLLKNSVESQNRWIRGLKKIIQLLSGHAKLSHKVAYMIHKKKFYNHYIPILELEEKDKNYTPKLDCLVIGSDEVFNCIQGNTNVGYSTELFGKNNCADRLISYAASFGNTTLNKLDQYKKTQEIGKLLQSFDAISVRDNNSYNIIRSLLPEKNISFHLDPVLIYDFMNQTNLIPDIKIDEKYLILYAYSGRITVEEAKWIREYAREKGMKVYAIGGIHPYTDRFIDCSPFSVLAYFQHCCEVITDTFHGTIFSVISQKPFTSLIRKSIGDSYGNEEKLGDLLHRLNIERRGTVRVQQAKKINEQAIDYEKINKVILEERKKTIEYLQKNIRGDDAG